MAKRSDRGGWSREVGGLPIEVKGFGQKSERSAKRSEALTNPGLAVQAGAILPADQARLIIIIFLGINCPSEHSN